MVSDVMPARAPFRRQPLWRKRLILVLAYQAPVLTAIGLALLVPVAMAAWDVRGWPGWEEARNFLIPSIIALFLGLVIRYRRPAPTTLTQTEALLVTTGVWLATSVLAALPFVLMLSMPFLDALLESVSGFTTAGTTMILGLDQLPRSILVWRALIQWLGGMGILLIVLLVGQAQGSHALSLLNAEGVKVSSGRLSFNFKQGAYRFTVIYLVLTLAQILLTWALGMPLFDAVTHAMTTVSTGGFSPHDESIAFYRNRPALFPNYVALELVITLFMLAGGVNFYILYRLGRGHLAALWETLEMRLLWLVLAGSTLLVAFNAWQSLGGTWPDWLLRSVFEIASLISTTGYETTATGSFPRLSREIFLLLMIVGGGAGSTAGGIKLVRLGLLGKFLSYEIRSLRLPPRAIHPPIMDGQVIPDRAFRQAVFILLLWLAYLGVGGIAISLLAPDLGIDEAYSTVFTAIGVFGPSFIPVARVIALPGLAKAIFILGMLAGRLEILPLLVFFNLAAWRR